MKKRIKKTTKVLALVCSLPFLSSCLSTPSPEQNVTTPPEVPNDILLEAQKNMEKIETEEHDYDTSNYTTKKGGPYQKVTVVPTISFYGRGAKVELEAMFLTNFTVFEDERASSGYGAKLDSTSSKAQFFITLPAGHYECLLNEKAFDNAKSKVNISIGGTSYTVYPSDPPLGSWELTTRVPIYFDVESEKTIPVEITTKTPGMNLDYIQFVKIN